MSKDIFIHITTELYKMTLLFPKKEPLRYKMREKAVDILSNLIAWESLFGFSPSLSGEVEEEKHNDFKDLIFTINKDLEVLDSYFELAYGQNWMSPNALLEIKIEYDKIKRNVKKEIQSLNLGEGAKSSEFSDLPAQETTPLVEVAVEEKHAEQPAREEISNVMDERKEKILGILREKGRAQVWEVQRILPEVSKRTIRRDFEKLLKQGAIERIGERNNTFYRLKTQEI